MKTEVINYLKDKYGLNPGDVNLPVDATIEDVDRIAEKFNLLKFDEYEILESRLLGDDTKQE